MIVEEKSEGKEASLKTIFEDFGDYDINKRCSPFIEAYTKEQVFYKAPEHIISKSTDFKSDVYSFGILLYELFALILPFEEEIADLAGNKENIKSVVKGNLRPNLTKLNPDCPEDIKALMIKCWDSNREDRPSSSEVAEIIQKVIQS